MEKKWELPVKKPTSLTDEAVASRLDVLACYPAIHERIVKLWGTKDLETWMVNWLADTRGHTRKGFPKEQSTALLALAVIHRSHLEAVGLMQWEEGVEVPSWAGPTWKVPKNF